MKNMIKALIILLYLNFSSIYADAPKEDKKGWTAYSQAVDVSDMENHEFKVSVAIKQDVLSKSSKSALWVRIDKKNNERGFFQNAVGSMDVTNEWQKFEIKGTVDKDALSLYFGAYVQNNGNFYFDDFKVEIKAKDESWEVLQIDNPGFESNLSSDSWNRGIRKNIRDKGINFEVAYSTLNPYEGKKSLHLTGKNILGSGDQGEYVDVNKVKLYYEIYGEGEPLLLIHGNGQSISAFMNQVDEFSRHYKVILVDSRGRGNSSYDREKELTYILQADDMKLLLEELKLESAHIVGWSDGGIIGLQMAIKYPEMVNSLVAMGANINPEGLIGLQAMKETILTQEKNNNGKFDMGLELQKLMAYHPQLKYEDLGVIKSKVLIMAGDHDLIKNEHTVKIFEAIPKGQLAILPKETHWFPQENSKLFNEIVLKFLQN